MIVLQWIQAEFIKLKYPPILWLCGSVLLAVFGIVFAAHILDINTVAALGINPWKRIGMAGRGIFVIFMSIPFIALLVSAAVYIEQQSNAWKYQYTIPRRRAIPFYTKLIVLQLCILLMLFFLCLGLLLSGYVLAFFLPELEFHYYTPPFLEFPATLWHAYLALMGVLGIQYFLSYRFEGFLIPATIGIIGFIIAFILSTMNSPLAIYFPYCYPFIVQDYDMFLMDKTGVVDYGWINTAQIYSLGCFAFFVLLGHLIEVRKNVV